MADASRSCPQCGGDMFVRPGHWTRCPSCAWLLRFPEAQDPVPAPIPCVVCGDLVRTQDEDAMCPECFQRNFSGALTCQPPTVARLADIPAVRRRELQLLDAGRWPLTQGREG